MASINSKEDGIGVSDSDEACSQDDGGDVGVADGVADGDTVGDGVADCVACQLLSTVIFAKATTLALPPKFLIKLIFQKTT